MTPVVGYLYQERRLCPDCTQKLARRAYPEKLSAGAGQAPYTYPQPHKGGQP